MRRKPPQGGVVLVIGGAGYIGSHACKALAAAGYCPVTYDNLSTGHHWAVKWGPLEVGDLHDRRRLDDVIATHGPDAVMHLAACCDVSESVADPAKYYRRNVVGSLHLLEAMRDHEVGRLIFSSTCATYGIPEHIPVREDARQNPISPYGRSKLVVEGMISDFSTAHRLEAMVLRYFNVAGADPENQIGESDEDAARLVPIVLQVAAGRRSHVTIFGSDYGTPDGTCIRDYVHVSDIARGHVLALRALESGAGSVTLNLGTERGCSVHEVIDAAAHVTGASIPTLQGARRPGDPASLISDATRARERLGWLPEMSDIDQIIKTAWAWHQRNAAPAAARVYPASA